MVLSIVASAFSAFLLFIGIVGIEFTRYGMLNRCHRYEAGYSHEHYTLDEKCVYAVSCVYICGWGLTCVHCANLEAVA